MGCLSLEGSLVYLCYQSAGKKHLDNPPAADYTGWIAFN